MIDYDPYAHAKELGLEVSWGRVHHEHDGEYYATQGLIILRRGLTARLERCTLAHEIVHAEFKDRWSPYGPVSWKQEHRANRIAAHRLIDEYNLQRAVRNSPDPGIWCIELAVTPDMLQTYLTTTRRHLEAVS